SSTDKFLEQSTLFASPKHLLLNPKFIIGGVSLITAMNSFKKILSAYGVEITSFGAGLPDHARPQPLSDVLQKIYLGKSFYPKYAKTEANSAIDFEEPPLKKRLAKFHAKEFGTQINPQNIIITAGSTPVLETMIKLTMDPTKNNVALTITPEYPNGVASVPKYNGTVDRTARFIPVINSTKEQYDKNGVPANRWQIDRASVIKALDNNRSKATYFYLNFPGNPTGYSPTADEYKKFAVILLKDIYCRRQQDLPPIAILEDIAYATMMHNDRKYYSMQNAIDDLKSEYKNNILVKSLLRDLENSLVTTHSFSKAFAIPGERFAYTTSKNQELLGNLNKAYLSETLTNGLLTIAAGVGAMDTGSVNKQAMQKYHDRLRFLEGGLNNINGLNNPITAQADAGFFTLANFKALHGKKLDRQTLNKIIDDVNKIEDSGQKQLLLKDAFKNGRINNAKDLSLWLLSVAKIETIPINSYKLQPSDLYVRLSVGQVTIKDINKALNNLQKAVDNLLGVNKENILPREININRVRFVDTVAPNKIGFACQCGSCPSAHGVTR
ncbi:MAG: pyridoxal phosphate-dependent aminotransferase, partial [Pseudomonadota bacterium]